MNRRAFQAACVMAAIGVLVIPARVAAQSVAYGYDGLGRLTTATYPGGQVVTYSYDAAGNRTEVTTSAPPPPPPPPAPLSASVDRTTYTRTAASVPSPITCQGNGGTAQYSYSWQWVSGDTLTEATAGSDATTGWFRPAASTTFRNSTWRCRVTDSTSATASSPTVAVSVRTN
jgi:YD repeat-containing protein